MREKSVCRFCQNEPLKSGTSGRRPFVVEGSTPHFAPDRPFRLEHIALDVTVDPRVKILKGQVTQRVKVVAPDQKRLVLDQIGLTVESVQVGSEKVDFRTEGNHLEILFRQAPRVDEVLQVTVKYQVSNPRRGLYFTGPDADYPKKPYQVWSQGQDEDNRYWFPTLDYPNQKATSEMQVTVPQGFTAISNGALISKAPVGEGTRFHYKLGIPQVTYLITLVVGEFSEWSEKSSQGVPIQYFVASGREEDGKRAFGNTAKMIEAFEKKTGILYPYEKYSQVAVQDFIFGGMENTSATTQTDSTLHDERAHLDFSSDPLVAHELAHQWFGNLLTCKDWSHGWLNEGFATFMERVWVEADPGPNGGFEEAKYYSYQDLKEYLDEDKGRYRRPIVCNQYIEPIDLFDTHLYQKGGLVVGLLRFVLGDGPFWKSIQLYLNRHRGQTVETLDLIRAIEDATGRNLRRLFDEWVFNAGYPEFEVSFQWHEEKKMTEWTIEQKQVGTQLFHLPVVLEWVTEKGEKFSHRVDIGEVKERIFLPSSQKPTRVRFDPDHWIPKTLKFPRSKELLLEQLAKDPDCMGRIEAAQELTKLADLGVVAALGKAAASDSFWGVQGEAAKALAEIRMDASRDALIAALNTKNPKARRNIAKALGSFKDDLSAAALQGLAKQDPSYFVEADSTFAWVSSKVRSFAKSSDSEIVAIDDFLHQQLGKKSYRDVIRSNTLQALSELPGISRGEQGRAMQTLMDSTKRGPNSIEVRVAAIRALGTVLRAAVPSERDRVLHLFSTLADEDHFRLRSQLVHSIEDSECAEGISILAKIRQLDSDGRVKRGAKMAISHLTLIGETPESVTQLKTALEKLEEDYRKLRSFVEERGKV